MHAALCLAAVALNHLPASGAIYTNTIAQVSAYITNQMAANNVQGMSIALVDEQGVAWAQGFGYADREAGVPADADTVYHVGSVSKAYLGAAYMQLLDQGRVDLEAPLTNYMAEFSMLERYTNSGTVTIRSLLNHHSGVPGDFFNGMVTTRVVEDYAPWLISCIKEDYPFMQVNRRNMYCNSGFVLLSDVIRRITGTNFPRAMDAMLLQPLGMESSSFLPDKAAISNRLAAAYDAVGARRAPEILNAMGSGSLYSSANDQARFILMIISNGQFQGQTFVSSNGIDTMTLPQLTNLPLNVSDSPAGLGWDIASDYRFRYAGKVFWKDGGTWFHCAYLGISRDLKLGVAVIQNTPGNLCDSVGAEALRWAILDKTGQPWPTNTYVPDPSPVTNRPQAELDALAGLYAGGEGYHKIEASAGSLALTVNAQLDVPTAVISNLVPRSNGWFAPSDSQQRQLAFTNLAGHDMLVLHGVDGAFASAEPLGELYRPGALPQAWSARTNRVYRMINSNPVEYFWEKEFPVTKTLRFKVKDGALMTDWMAGNYVIEPQTDSLAFQRGTHYRKGGAVQSESTNGFELVRYSSYLFLDEAAIPTLASGSVANGTIPFAGGTQWYWFSGQTGKTYRAHMDAGLNEVFVRITDREGIVLASGSTGVTSFACSSNATFAIAVSATNVFEYSLGLSLSGRSQAQADYDGDRKADPAVYLPAALRAAFAAGDESTPSTSSTGSSQAGSGQAGTWKVKLSSANYYQVTTTLNGLGGPGYESVPADYDGDLKADPAVYCESSGAWAILLSSANYSVVIALGQTLGGPGWAGAPADYDGDLKADPAVCRSAQGDWCVLLSSAGYARATVAGLLGGGDCVAVPADYDGDRLGDPALYNEATGCWVIKLSGAGYAAITMARALGGENYLPCPGDFDGDGFADPAVKNIFGNEWIVMFSGGNYVPVSLELAFE